jgi:hypothetical protein
MTLTGNKPMKSAPEADVQFLAELTAATIESACVYPGQETVGMHEGKEIPVKNLQDFTAIRPAGLRAYPAIWVQDFTMGYSSGLVSVEEGLGHLRLIASLQNSGPEQHLPSGAIIPTDAIPDHINLDGTAVFYPGTYSSGPDQGGEPWGVCPPLNNYFDFIWLAYLLWKETGDAGLFRMKMEGRALLDRLTAAYAVPPADPATGMVFTAPERRAVGFIFIDQIYMTGRMLMASLERYRAAGQLAEIHVALGDAASAQRFSRDADLIRANIEPVFVNPDAECGWLRASTGVSGQADVWGTLYALYLDTLSPPARNRAVLQVLADMEGGNILFEGAVRHVPVNRDASPTSAWEKTIAPHNRYQNGAFWHMPVGWLIAVLECDHPDKAAALFQDYIAHLRKNDFRQGAPYGAPWECIGWNRQADQNPAFVPSVATPYGVLFNRHERASR